MSCLFPTRSDSGTFPCGNCFACRETASRTAAGQQLMEFKACEGRAFFITLTYAPEHLPLTKACSEVAIFRDNDLTHLQILKKRTGYSPDLITKWSEIDPDYKQHWLDMRRAKHEKKLRSYFKKGEGTFTPEQTEMKIHEALQRKEDWLKDHPPVAIVSNVPGAPTWSHEHQLKIKDGLRNNLKKLGITKFGYAMIADYGENGTLRPHWHINLFIREATETNLSTKQHVAQIRKAVQSFWTYGTEKTLPMLPDGAYYVASYLTDKKVGDYPARSMIDNTTIRPEGAFAPRAWLSNRPGLGYSFVPTIAKVYGLHSKIHTQIPAKHFTAVHKICAAKGIHQMDDEAKINLCKDHPAIKPEWVLAACKIHELSSGMMRLNIMSRTEGTSKFYNFPLSNHFKRALFKELKKPDQERHDYWQRNTNAYDKEQHDKTDIEIATEKRENKQRVLARQKRYFEHKKQKFLG